MLLLKRIRNKMILKSKFALYLAYSLGEIILVVVGILVAIQIDDWNRDRELNQQELESYQLIISDLKRDSTLFVQYQGAYNDYLDTYFKLNDIAAGKGSLKGILPDFLVSNIQFNPVTKSNHQITIEKLRNNNIREQINNYFVRLNQVEQATKEFNEMIVTETRPFFLKEHEVFNNAVAFDKSDRTFPPYKGVSTIDTVKLKSTMNHPYFVPLISQLRMGIGYYLATLEGSMKANHMLIEQLKKSLKEADE